jgi:ABC-type uncharacterized transport system permease subunit
MQATIGVSPALVDVVQGLMVILVLGATTLLYFARRRGRSGRRRRSRTKQAFAREIESARP